MATQTEAIRAHLEAGGTLTQLEAYELFRCWRLAPRIMELRAAGLDIDAIPEHRNGKRYARYRIAAPQRDLFAPAVPTAIRSAAPAGERGGATFV